MSKREFRFLPAKELRVATQDGKRTLSGYAAVFNSLSEDLGGFREKIAPTAFDKCLASSPDIVCLRDHKQELLMGRTKSGTLRVAVDQIGLKFDCDLPDTTQAADLAASIERGDLDACSFGMYCLNDDWMDDAGVLVRTIMDADVFDVSAVTYPAYQATSVSLRSLFPDGEVKAPAKTEKRDMSDDDTTDDGMSDCGCDCPECEDGDCMDCSMEDCNDPNCPCYDLRSMMVKIRLAEADSL